MAENRDAESVEETVAGEVSEADRPSLVFVGADKPVPKYTWTLPCSQPATSTKRKRPKRYTRKRKPPVVAQGGDADIVNISLSDDEPSFIVNEGKLIRPGQI